MGKHLTIEEKLNADNELQQNRIIMKWLRKQLNAFKYRNHKLENYLHHKNKSKHNGLYGINGSCYTMFGKKFKDLTIEERRAYHQEMRIRRNQKGETNEQIVGRRNGV